MGSQFVREKKSIKCSSYTSGTLQRHGLREISARFLALHRDSNFCFTMYWTLYVNQNMHFAWAATFGEIVWRGNIQL